MKWAWAIGEALVLAVLIREWISIRRELRQDAALREAANATTDGSSAARHAEGQHQLNERVTEARE